MYLFHFLCHLCSTIVCILLLRHVMITCLVSVIILVNDIMATNLHKHTHTYSYTNTYVCITYTNLVCENDICAVVSATYAYNHVTHTHIHLQNYDDYSVVVCHSFFRRCCNGATRISLCSLNVITLSNLCSKGMFELLNEVI